MKIVLNLWCKQFLWVKSVLRRNLERWKSFFNLKCKKISWDWSQHQINRKNNCLRTFCDELQECERNIWKKFIHADWMQWSRHLSVDRSCALGRSEFSLSFWRKGRLDALKKILLKSSIEILISSEKKFKLVYCVLLGKRISRKY